MDKDYGSWKLASLRAELEKRNAKRTGRKAVLVQRLQEYDILFGDIVNNPECTYIVQTPDGKLFRDINSDMTCPSIDVEDVKRYCLITDNENNDRARKMYKDNYLLTFRIAAEGQHHFIKAQCASEMRKNIQYNVVIKYEQHIIEETQCECAAGIGPHAQCKHVLAVLQGLLDFSTKKDINLRSSCTSNLQTFHQPTRFFKGSPVTADNLKLKEKDETFKDMINFDPRPAASKSTIEEEKYKEHFKSLCANFCGLTGSSIPIAQILYPANKMALCLDHDYMEKTQEEIFLDDLKLTPSELKELQETTQNANKKWKVERTKRLHSSKFEKICKVKEINKKKIAKSLLKSIEDVTSPAMIHGRKYEKKALNMFVEKTGLEILNCGIVVDEELQFLATTPDGLIGEDSVIEVKCPFTAAEREINPETVPYIELCEESGNWQLNRNHDYFYQIQGQLYCTKRALCYFAIYTHVDFCVIKVKRDEVFIKHMIEKLSNFYENHYKELFLRKYLYGVKI